MFSLIKVSIFVIFMISLLISGCGGDTEPSERKTQGLIIPLSKGVAQDNGGTPWYAVWTIGRSNSTNGGGQKLKMMMDTGTSNLWVSSSQCENSGCATHNRYDMNNSSTWKSGVEYPSVFSQQLGSWGRFLFNYGIDEWFVDAVKFRQNLLTPQEFNRDEAFTSSGIAVSDINFQMAVELINGEINGYFNRNWDQLVCDGGIGFPLFANPNVSSSLFLNEMVSQGLIEHRILAFWTDPDLKRGELFIGGWNPALVNLENFNQLNVNDVGRKNNGWIVNLDGFKVGEKNIDLPARDGVSPNLQLDTGSSRFKGDPDYINMIVDAITSKSGSGTIVYDENNLDNYPDLTISLNGVDYRLTARQYFQRFVSYDPKTNEGQLYWKLAFHPLEGLDGILLVGSILLDTLYSVYIYPDTLQNDEHMIYLGKYNTFKVNSQD